VELSSTEVSSAAIYSRELGMYIQKYCGCVFSEEERYLKAKKILR